MSKFWYAAGLALAGALGAAAGWYVAKTRYEQLAHEDFLARKEKDQTPDEKSAHPWQVTNECTAGTLCKEAKNAYERYSGSSNTRGLEQKNIFVIDPEELGDKKDYSISEWTFYAGDGVLADELDRPVKHTEEAVGTEWENRMGEYEDDIVCVRNDILRCYIEISRDLRPYKEIESHLPIVPEEDE